MDVLNNHFKVNVVDSVVEEVVESKTPGKVKRLENQKSSVVEVVESKTPAKVKQTENQKSSAVESKTPAKVKQTENQKSSVGESKTPAKVKQTEIQKASAVVNESKRSTRLKKVLDVENGKRLQSESPIRRNDVIEETNGKEEMKAKKGKTKKSKLPVKKKEAVVVVEASSLLTNDESVSSVKKRSLSLPSSEIEIVEEKKKEVLNRTYEKDNEDEKNKPRVVVGGARIVKPILNGVVISKKEVCLF